MRVWASLYRTFITAEPLGQTLRNNIRYWDEY
jgi:hypothetical protein